MAKTCNIYEGPSQSVSLNKIKHDSLYLKMDINGIFINCLVDTGSTLTVLHSRKYFAISPDKRPTLLRSGVRLKMANGELVTTMGQAYFCIEVNGKSFKQRFIVADIDVPAVLGYDFLHLHHCKIDMGGGKLTIGGIELICKKESQMTTIFNVLPTYSEVVIEGVIEGDSTHLTEAVLMVIKIV